MITSAERSSTPTKRGILFRQRQTKEEIQNAIAAGIAIDKLSINAQNYLTAMQSETKLFIQDSVEAKQSINEIDKTLENLRKKPDVEKSVKVKVNTPSGPNLQKKIDEFKRKFEAEPITIDVLGEQSAALEQQLQQSQDYYEQESLLRQEADNQELQDTINQSTNLTNLETEANRLRFEIGLAEIQATSSAKAQAKLTELKTEQAHNKNLIAIERQKISDREKLKQEEVEFNKSAASEMFELGQALLSSEAGSFKKYLANKLRQLTQYVSTQLYIEGLAAASNPFTAALSFGFFAAGAAVQAAGELGAAALERSAAADASAANISPASAAVNPTPAAPAQTNTANDVVQTSNNNTSTTQTTEINIYQNGTFLDSAQAIRSVVQPALEQLAAQNGRVIL